MKLIFMNIGLVVLLGFTSCSGGESNEESSSDSTEVVETVPSFTYDIDTAQTLINWKGYESMTDRDHFHNGTIKAQSGTFTIEGEGEEAKIIAGEILIDMNSIAESKGLVGLENHLMSADFFDVNNFMTSKFTLESHEDGMVKGKLTVRGKELNMEAPVTMAQSEGSTTLTFDTFTVDMTSLEMPFFDLTDADPEEDHADPALEFSAVVVGTTSEQ